MRSGSSKTRLGVVEKLAASGDDEEAVGPLIFSLKDKEASIRCIAAKALKRFADRRAVEPLILMLHDTVPLARAAAAETLGFLGDPLAVNSLVGLLRDGDPVVRAIAARGLHRLGWRPGTDSQRVLQILAMGSLHQLIALGPEGVAPLLETLRNGPPNKQFSAVKALGEINDPRVPRAMLEALHKSTPSVRIAALGTLERLADPASYPEIERLLTDNSASVRGAAVEAASRCGGTLAVPALLKCLSDTSWEVRQAAAIALGSLGERSAVPGLCELVEDPDRDVRESVIAALGQICDRRAIGPLVTAMVDPETSVRNQAAGALRKMDRRWEHSEAVQTALPKIKLAFNNPDYWVRYSASRLLEQLNIDVNTLIGEAAPAIKLPATTKEAAPHPAYSVLSDLLFDRDLDLRLAAAAAFGRLREKNALSLLAAAARDNDVSVRHAVQAALAAMN